MWWAAQIGGFYTKNLQGSPSLKCSSWDSLLKSAHFQHFFFIVWLQNSNNDFDAFQKLMKSELFGCLSIKAEGELHMCKICWYVPPKLVYFTHSVNMGPIVTPPKNNNNNNETLVVKFWQLVYHLPQARRFSQTRQRQLEYYI